ncbi:MAG: molybdopterin dinucleotide binding domain-containing protein, partial [Planctomycetota bacterium]
RVLPHYKLDQADVIVAFGADFLGTWISPVEFTAAWQTRRAPTKQHPEMSYHVQFEGRLSLTGGNADRRYRLSPAEYGNVLSHLATRLSKLAGVEPPAGTVGESPIAEHDLDELAARLWHARGASLVLSDSQDVSEHVLVNYINHLLDNYNKTVDIERPSRQRQGNDAGVLELVEELKDGKVVALFVAGTDLTHNLPDREAIAAGIGKAKLVVSFAEREDDFGSLANYVCPDHHPLESWLDAEPIAGLVSLSQPTLQPLGGTRSILESLGRWTGKSESAYEILRANWREHILPRVESQPFQVFWDKAVHDGFVITNGTPHDIGEFHNDAVALIGKQSADDFTLALYSKIGLTDSRHAHNPWLQELPDPTTKVTWDNYACVSPATAENLSLADGDLVRVETSDGNSSVELPALVQPGQHDGVVAIALGYGVRGTDRFTDIGPKWLEARPTVALGELVGKNVASFIEARGGQFQYTVGGIKLTKTGGRRDLASTQQHHTLEVPRNVAP